ncbi:aminotransferase class IV family protein [Jiangella mangrovi]|uniref:Branched-subunit amino acid aminotransferase/4-amino-4-deoxychorismate lyase n=1 Tax=Jiangella mangrovi TaxID=1524084 RepID=A0A7W9GSH0_9ACTN|nr:aminotransferase class IV family protein [Jiangella mangrovi]MBB5789112.1 branched-subunit amino acid aminotransferase/4-amino-4-deoxychorismate lyase [Jiangella mangrovi]
MIVHRNGRAATADDLAPLAFAGYAHFTAAQVRDRRIRGLDLHLERLRTASLELFGTALPDDVVRTHLRTALAAGPADVSLMATVYSAAGEFTAADGALDLLVRTGPPLTGPDSPLALAVVEHERYLPAVKHVGEVAKTHVLRTAAAVGFDDAAFVDRQGRLSEASIWNLAFWDGSAVVWPVADVLGGITMGILRRQLAARGVPQRDAEVRPGDLVGLTGAVVMNSWTPGIAVHRIGEAALPAAPEFVALLHEVYGVEPLTAP